MALFAQPIRKRFHGIPTRTALEVDFPIGAVSLLAEKESWRKEIHRPATHTHKWWAQRLGTVFRSILLGAVSETAADVTEAVGGRVSLEGAVVYDPFAGSGTTLVEAAKLGCRVIGRDINPVATLVQRQALAVWDFAEIEALFKEVERDCCAEITQLYQSRAGDDVLYYFWVSRARCPDCRDEVELFSDRVFARHAYPRRYPTAQALCPICKDIVVVDLSTDREVHCGSCHARSPFDGAVHGQVMTCAMGHRNKVVDALANERPTSLMYAKLVANSRGEKRYERIDDYDDALFAEACSRRNSFRDELPQPSGRLEHGHNTRQALRWGFSGWEDFFNDRQLYSLGRLGEAVRCLTPLSNEREALIALFSGTLEFNNLFCSYKGEGTGAVRHIFSHHILKPERTPLEANPWGTPLSSGSFSTLFERRLRRAHEYKRNPHDLQMWEGSPQRVWGMSSPIAGKVATTFDDFEATSARFYVASGDSAQTDLPDASVDLIVTDPPFMDNVHYSELADFFHAWLGEMTPFPGYPSHNPTTRSDGEVQNADPAEFGLAIAKVFQECSRVLKDGGLLAFTFHQARVAGWIELMTAVRQAGFVVTALQPIKAEMSRSATKSRAGHPSNLDSVVVCRKRPGRPVAASPAVAASMAVDRLSELKSVGVSISRTDVASVVRGTILALMTSGDAYSLEELCHAATTESEDAQARLLGGC